jgi:hypothetical protein
MNVHNVVVECNKYPRKIAVECNKNNEKLYKLLYKYKKISKTQAILECLRNAFILEIEISNRISLVLS